MDLRAVDVNLVVQLEALLDTSSVTRAAERLGLSVGATSHALRRLRDQLQDPLLVRAGRSMVLTERAEALRERVRGVVAELSQVLAPAPADAPSELRRTFRLRATDHVLYLLGPRLDRLAEVEAPGVSLWVAPNTAEDPFDLREGRVDATIGVYSGLPPELRIRRLFTDSFACVVRAAHSGVGEGLSLEDFVGLTHVLISPRGRPGSTVDSVLAGRGLERRVVRVVPYFLAGLELVARSDHVLTVSRRLAEALAPSLGLRVLEPPIALPTYALQLLWHPRHDGDAGHAWLRDALVRAAG